MWALSHSTAAHKGLRNAYFAERGLVSETPRTYGIFLRENREIRESLTADGAVGRKSPVR